MTNKLINVLKLNKLSNECKENIYNKLLKDKYKATIIFVNKEGRWNEIDVKFYNNDLCLSSFYLNFYHRTSKACKGLRYKTFGQAITQLKRMLKDYPVIYSNLHIYNDGSWISGNQKHLFDIEL